MAVNSAPTTLIGKLSSQVWNSYTIVMKPGQTIEDALESGFWSHVTKFIRPYDTFRLIAEDGAYVAEILATTAAGTFVKMVEMWRWERPDGSEAASIEDGPQVAYVKYRGPTVRWCVLRSADHEPLKEGFHEKPDAEAWLRQYIATITR